jgi:two-component system copper resistance phosphate regulon response regulator CusR
VARILVVDGEPRTTLVLDRALTEYGHGVDAAADGPQALELAATGAYRLVLLDLALPGEDGMEVLRRMIAARPEQEVMVLSAQSEVETKVRCLDLGAVDYVTKPVSLAELLARVRRRLAGTGSERLLRAGPVTLDLQRRVVDIGAGPIPLTGREFLLLRHLMMQPGEVCTRADLLSEVWGYSFDPGTNVVDVCVRRLRAKVGAERIETIRNVGYAFQASSPLHPGLGLSSPVAENGNGKVADEEAVAVASIALSSPPPPESWTEIAEKAGKAARAAAKVIDGRSASYAMVAAARASAPLSGLYAVWLP